MRVYTTSGSVYHFQDGYVTRVSPNPLRRDEETLYVHSHTPPEVGQPMVMYLQPLAEWADITVRTTSRVTAVYR